MQYSYIMRRFDCFFCNYLWKFSVGLPILDRKTSNIQNHDKNKSVPL